jgi:hypothetical protein
VSIVSSGLKLEYWKALPAQMHSFEMHSTIAEKGNAVSCKVPLVVWLFRLPLILA